MTEVGNPTCHCTRAWRKLERHIERKHMADTSIVELVKLLGGKLG